ncbi:MAG: hypothetical protein IT347_14160 [Candidatus Eisenbacteria bacterium]|nr:hypothetical protein [Candidatus Eisenbacteria bacterium]
MNVAGVVRSRLALVRAWLWTRSRGRLRPRAGVATAALALLLAAALGAALAMAFGGLRSAGLPEAGARVLLAWLFTATLTGVLVFDLHEALAALVTAPDLDLLRAAPLSPRALTALRLLDALPRSLPIVLTLALPATAAFASAYGLRAPDLAGAVPALLALWLAPLGAGLALALPLARALPPARARDLLGMLATFALVAAWLANALLVPRAGFDEVAAGAIGALPAPPRWLPSTLAAQALATDGPRAGAMGWLALSAIAGLALAWWSTRRHLEAALDRSQEAPRRLVVARGRLVRATLAGAFLFRDARLFARQWTVAADVVAASLLWMLLPLLSAPLLPAPERELARSMLVLLAVGIGYEVGARAFALERGGVAWARIAPTGAMRWVLGRLAGVGALAAAMLVPAGAAVMVGFHLPVGALAPLAEWTLSAAAVSISLGLLTGAAFADPDWNHPRAMLSPAGRLAGTALLLVQAAGWLGLAFSGLGPPAGLLLGSSLAVAGIATAGAGLILSRRDMGTGQSV